jgi:hypothetical protein
VRVRIKATWKVLQTRQPALGCGSHLDLFDVSGRWKEEGEEQCWELIASLSPSTSVVSCSEIGASRPFSSRACTGSLIRVRVEKQDIGKEFEIAKNLAKTLVRAKQPLAAQVAEAVTSAEVPDTAVGLLIVDGEFVKVLEPGLHAFWKFHRALKTELVDRRVQSMEVAGQEILTRDKVSLRVNLSALWQVLDVVKARSELVNFVEFVYKELQFALREAVGSRTLDELLGHKGVLDREIAGVVGPKIEEHGLAVRSVMDENPTLLRLKELETLEKVTEKIDKLTVFGGLDGVLKDVVRIRVPGA